MGDSALPHSLPLPLPQLGYYFSHFYQLNSECICCEGRHGCLV